MVESLDKERKMENLKVEIHTLESELMQLEVGSILDFVLRVISYVISLVFFSFLQNLSFKLERFAW